jgi:DNA-binding MarR family transcriptional regulator
MSKEIEKINTSIARLSRQASVYVKKHASDDNLSAVMFRVCSAVYYNDGISQDGISRMEGMDKSSVAKIVSKAESLGYLNKDINPDDRRQHQLHLTAEGAKEVKEILSILNEWGEKILEGISTEERAEVKSVLARALANADRNH